MCLPPSISNSQLQVAWAPGTEWEVAAGMLDIFHKLPGQAKKFLETNGEPPCPSFLLLLSFKLLSFRFYSVCSRL